MTQRYAFMGFEFDVEGRLLTKAGDVVAVRPKTLAVLELLVRHRERPVSKDAILAAVWSGRMVEEQAVFQSISELRALLGDASSIRTIRGRGYQWVAETREEPERRRAPSVIWAAAAALVLGIVSAALQWSPPSPAPEIIVRDIGQSTDRSSDSGLPRSGMESLVVEHLRRLGWRSYSFAAKPKRENALYLDTEFLPHESGIAVHYALHAGDDVVTGEFRSPSSLGAIRDLANAIEPLIASAATEEGLGLSFDTLFDTATSKIDAGRYGEAEAYLHVLIEEQPEFNAARLALTYTLLQDGRSAEALPVALEAHRRADASSSLQDRMNAEVLLTQVYRRLGARGEARRFAESALALGTRSNDLLVVAEAQEQLGELAIDGGRLEAGRRQLDSALELYRAFCPSGERRVTQRLVDLEAQRGTVGKDSTVL